MLFRKLREYGLQLGEGTTYYQEDEIRLVIDLESVASRARLLHTNEGEIRLPVPKVFRTSGTMPFLLVDGPEYVFGLPVGDDGAKSVKRAERRRAAFVDLVDHCAEETGNPKVQVVAEFLSGEKYAEVVAALVGKMADGILTAAIAKQWIAFRVDGSFVHLEPDASAFWAREVNRQASAGEGQCSVCGRTGALAKKSLVKAKGINAGALTSANETAFESFGLAGWLTTPVCVECIGVVTAAFNDLMDTGKSAKKSAAELQNRGGNKRIGSAKMAYWTPTDRKFGTLAMSAMYDPEPEDVRLLLDSPHSGTGVAGFKEGSFHSFTASANSGRVVFRDWVDFPIGKVSESLRTWFERVQIVDHHGDQSAVGIGRLIASTVRRPADIRAADYLALIRTALFASPFPPRLLDAAVRRAVSERKVTHARAALIKAAVLYLDPGRPTGTHIGATWWRAGLTHNGKEGGEVDTEAGSNLAKLDPNHPEPAYHLGRLLAVLDSIQYAAQDNSTVIERYIGGAMANPAAVFPRLVEMSRKAHLPKVGRSKSKGHRINLQKQIEELIPARWPRRLTLLERGLFISGMHHQEAHRRATSAAARAAWKLENGP